MMKKGFAQIPLMLGLLLMAVAVPVATKLVQTNQDTRNKAAHICGALGQGCCLTEYVGATPIYNTCNSPLKCNGGKCSTTGAPTATKTPLTPTVAGGCTSASGRPYLANGATYCESPYLLGSRKWKCTNGVASVVQNYLVARNCEDTIPTLSAGGCRYLIAGVTETLTNGQEKCYNLAGSSLGSQKIKCSNGSTSVVQTYVQQNCQAILPTLSAGGCRYLWAGVTETLKNGEEKCYNLAFGNYLSQKVRCNNGDISSVQIYALQNCQGLPTPYPTVPPTYTCTGISGQYCALSGAKCNGNLGEISGTGTCPDNRYCCKVKPTTIPTLVPCIRDGNETTSASLCCSKITHRDTADNALVCGPIATPTPTLTLRCFCNGLSCKDAEACMWRTQSNSLFNLSCSKDYCDGIPRPTATPTRRPGEPTPTTKPTIKPTQKPTNVPTDPPSNKCTACPSTFACYKNGSEYKWFGKGIAMNGFTLTNDADCSGIEKPSYKGKSRGDANCDGSVDVVDYSLWHKEFFDGGKGSTVKSTWYADFTGSDGKCDGKVDTYDFSLWQKYFNELKNI